MANGAALSRAPAFSFFKMPRTTKADDLPAAQDLLRSGVWSVAQVAVTLDTPECLVERWCRLRMIPGAFWREGRWHIPGPGLFFFCAGKIEPRYSPETTAALLDMERSTVRSWIKHGRLKKAKWGLAKAAAVRVTESELRRFLDGKQEE